MNSQDIKVALIGCGRVAGHHCLSIKKTKNISLAAVCDLSERKAKAYADKYNVPFFSNYRRMIESHPEIDVIAIITPSGMHREHTLEIIQDYEKHVIVEKPTFIRPKDAEEAFQLATNKKVEIFPVFQNRYNKSVIRVRRAIADGELGDIHIVSVRVRWCRPQRYYQMAEWRGTFSHDGGALANQCIHHVDLTRHLGGEITHVNATMRTLGADIEVEDSVVATMKYNGNTIGVLEGTTAARPDDFEASLSIVGSKGLAQIGGVAVNELQIFTPDPKACIDNSEDFIGIKGHGAVYGYGHSTMYHDIVNHLTGKAPYPVGRADCIATLKLLHAFYRSDEIGNWVAVDSKKQSSRLGRTNEKISNLYRTPRFTNE